MRKLAFALACAVFAATGVFAVMTFIRSDKTPPVISVSSQLICDPELTEEELLTGVEARDAVDGDVCNSLVVESFTVDHKKGTGIVVYAARDRRNNVAKIARFLEAPEGFTENSGSQTTEEEADTEKETHPFEETHVQALDVLAGFSENRTTEQPKTGFSETSSNTLADTVTETETETESEEFQETNPGAPKLTLTQNSVTLKKGDTFNPLAYVDVIEDDYDNIYALWQDIQIRGEYDMTEEGTYTLYYYVIDSSGNISNQAKFNIVVE